MTSSRCASASSSRAICPSKSLTVDKPSKFTSDVARSGEGLPVQSRPRADRQGRRRARWPSSTCRPCERLRQLQINEPRVATYIADLGARYILVNIPSAQLEAVNFGAVYSRHNIVAGKIDRPSPTLVSRISEINFNPYWNAPDSIVERDLIPKLMKDPNALAEDAHPRSGSARRVQRSIRARSTGP